MVVESDYVNGGYEVIADDNSSTDDGGAKNDEQSSSWLSSWRRGWK